MTHQELVRELQLISKALCGGPYRDDDPDAELGYDRTVNPTRAAMRLGMLREKLTREPVTGLPFLHSQPAE